MLKTPKGMSWADEAESEVDREVEMEAQLLIAVEESGGEQLPAWAMRDLLEVILPATGGNNYLLSEDSNAYGAAEDLIDSSSMDLNDMSKEEEQYAKDAHLLNNAQRVTYRFIIKRFLHPENVRSLLEGEQERARIPLAAPAPAPAPAPVPAPAPSANEYIIYAIQQSRGGKCFYVKYKSKHNGKESWSLPKRSFDPSMTPDQALEDALLNDLGLPAREVASLLRNVTQRFTLQDRSKVYHAYVLRLTGKMSRVNMYETTNAVVNRISWKDMGNHTLVDLNGITCQFERKMTGRCGGTSSHPPRNSVPRGSGSGRGRRGPGSGSGSSGRGRSSSGRGRSSSGRGRSNSGRGSRRSGSWRD